MLLHAFPNVCQCSDTFALSIWNNKGDTATLFDESGREIDKFVYKTEIKIEHGSV